MRGVLSFFKNVVILCGVVMMGTVLLIVRYILKTPQPLESVLPGEARLYKGTCGHVYYKVSGPVEAAPMVLFHAPGIGGSAYEMRGIMAGLAQQYRVYALDLPGFGLSDHLPIDYTAATYIALFRDFLTSVVRRPALLLASGLSGNYCVILAQQHPALCEGLVLLTSPAVPATSAFERLLAFITRLPFLRIALYSLLSMRVVLRAFIGRHYLSVNAQTRNEIGDHRFAVAHQLHAYRAALAYLAGKLDTTDITASLASLQQPTLQIQGMVDEEQSEAVVRHICEWQKSLCAPIEEIEAYCVKCKQKHIITGPQSTAEKWASCGRGHLPRMWHAPLPFRREPGRKNKRRK